MSKSLISADGSSRASPPWKVCFRRRWRVSVWYSLMLYLPRDEVCAFEKCMVQCVIAWPWLPGTSICMCIFLCSSSRGRASEYLLLWPSRSWGWLVHCLSVYHVPGGEMGPWLRPWPDYILMCVLCVKSWLYCKVTAMWCAHQARVGVSYIYNVHVMYSAGYFAQQHVL